MLTELVVATLVVLASVLTHGFGLFTISNILGLEREERRAIGMASPRAVGRLLAVVMGMFILHGLVIWGWAGVYLMTGALDDVRNAVYFSCFTYSTLGDPVTKIPEDWMLLAAIEGITGVLLMGWSTAFLVTLVLRWGRD